MSQAQDDHAALSRAVIIFRAGSDFDLKSRSGRSQNSPQTDVFSPPVVSLLHKEPDEQGWRSHFHEVKIPTRDEEKPHRANLYSWDKFKETDLFNTVEKNNVFDFNNQLTSHQVVENSIPIANYSFSYDAGGNALTRELDGASKNFEYSTDNRISTVDSNSAQYDNDGNLVSITIDGVTKNFSYDSRNRLTGDSQISYSYDSEDRRISKTVGTDTTSYAIDPSERLSKVLVKTINGVSTYYVYGLGLISEETNADYKLYHFDYRGSTILLTDGTGQITDSYSYGPFGNIENHTGTSVVDYLFLGQFGVITDENELVFMNDRYYAPYIGRFLNEDPYSLRYNDITNLNLYGYCGNDPINNVDPSGNFLETLFDAFSVAYSAADFFSDPTGAKLATLIWDTAAAVLPFVPGSYVKKGLSLADDAFDLVKGGLDDVLESLSRSQKRNVETLDNVIANNLKDHDFSGTLRDLQGNPVPKPNGGFWDHKTEMLQSYKALTGVQNGLVGSLKNPNLSPEVARFLQGELNKTNSYIQKIENLFAPFGGVK